MGSQEDYRRPQKVPLRNAGVSINNRSVFSIDFSRASPHGTKKRRKVQMHINLLNSIQYI